MKIPENRKRSILLIVIAVVISVVIVLSITTTLIKVKKKKEEYIKYAKQYEELTGENDVARKKLDALLNEDDTSYYVEFYDDVAHDNGYIRPDEEMYVRNGS